MQPCKSFFRLLRDFLSGPKVANTCWLAAMTSSTRQSFLWAAPRGTAQRKFLGELTYKIETFLQISGLKREGNGIKINWVEFGQRLGELLLPGLLWMFCSEQGTKVHENWEGRLLYEHLGPGSRPSYGKFGACGWQVTFRLLQKLHVCTCVVARPCVKADGGSFRLGWPRIVTAIGNYDVADFANWGCNQEPIRVRRLVVRRTCFKLPLAARASFALLGLFFEIGDPSSKVAGLRPMMSLNFPLSDSHLKLCRGRFPIAPQNLARTCSRTGQ